MTRESGVKDLTPTTHSINIFTYIYIYIYTYLILHITIIYYIYITCTLFKLSCGTQWVTMLGLMFLLMFTPKSVHKMESTVDLQGLCTECKKFHLQMMGYNAHGRTRRSHWDTFFSQLEMHPLAQRWSASVIFPGFNEAVVGWACGICRVQLTQASNDLDS